MASIKTTNTFYKKLLNLEELHDIPPTCNFSFLGFHKLSHHGQDILTSLRPSISNIQVMQCHILDNLLLLVHISFWKWNILLGLLKQNNWPTLEMNV